MLEAEYNDMDIAALLAGDSSFVVGTALRLVVEGVSLNPGFTLAGFTPLSTLGILFLHP